MNFSMSKLTWGLLIALLVLNTLILTGMVTGVIPDLMRLVAGLGMIVSIGIDWRNARQG